jgi:hypothetical protein
MWTDARDKPEHDADEWQPGCQFEIEFGSGLEPHEIETDPASTAGIVQMSLEEHP